MQEIKRDLKADLEGSEAAKFQRDETAGSLSAAIKELPEFNRSKLSYNFNFELMNKVNEAIVKRNIVKLAELELAMATGFNSEGEELSEKAILSQLTEQLSSKVIDQTDKFRLMALALMCLELKGKERQEYLGILKAQFPDFDKGLAEICPKRFRLKDRKAKKEDEGILLGNRHNPLLTEMISLALSHK